MQVVVAITTAQGIVASVTIQGIAAITAGENIVTGITHQIVIAIGGLLHQLFDSGHIQTLAIGKGKVLYRVGAGAILIEVALHLQAIIRALDADIEAVAGAGEHHIGTIDRQLDGVGIGTSYIAVVVVDGVLARALTKEVSIRTVIALQRVVTGSAIQGVTAYITVEGIVTRATDQGVITSLTIEGIVAITTHQPVIAIATLQVIVAVTAA